ncbi:hypothetical protein VULLAG_LOCUS9583 [Vulpes lagopus]
MHREPDMGLDPGSPGSRPGPKAGAKPLRHPGIPAEDFKTWLKFLDGPGIMCRRHVHRTTGSKLRGPPASCPVQERNSKLCPVRKMNVMIKHALIYLLKGHLGGSDG